VDSLMRHPFILLVAGALLSGLIVPLITRSWQNRQKVLEIKTALVSEISKAVMEFFMSVQFVHLRKEMSSGSEVTMLSQQQAEFDQQYKTWEVQSAIIGTKLEAYLSQSEIPSKWADFSTALTRFYALEGVPETDRLREMAALAKRISEALPVHLPQKATWLELREALLHYKSSIIKDILRAKISFQ
jgi:hypothetical protein